MIKNKGNEKQVYEQKSKKETQEKLQTKLEGESRDRIIDFPFSGMLFLSHRVDFLT